MSLYDRVSDAQASLLAQHLGRHAFSGQLGNQAAQYVLRGTEEGVLGSIRKWGVIARWSPARPGPANPEYENIHKLLGRLVDLDDPRLLVRLARVYRAADEGIGVMGAGSTLWPEAPWLDSWLGHCSNHLQYAPGRGVPLIASAQLAAMLESEGLAEELLVRPLLKLMRGARTYQECQPLLAVQNLAKTGDYGKLLARHAELIRDFLRNAAAPDRVPVLEWLRQTECDPEPFRTQLLEFATGSAKTVRDAAEALLVRIKDAVRAELERIAGEGPGKRRGQALELMASFYGPPATAPPAPVPVPMHVPLSAEAREAFRGLVAAQNRALAEVKLVRTVSARGLDEADIQNCIHALETLTKPSPEMPGMFGLGFEGMKEAEGAFADAPGLELIHVVRLLLLNGRLRAMDSLGGYFSFLRPAGEILDRFRRRRSFTLPDLAAVLRALGIDDRSIALSMAEREGIFLDWPSELVAPYLTQHVDILESFLRVRPSPPWRYAADGVFRMLEHLPEVPPQLLPRLWELATGEADGERALAKSILAKLPGLDERLIRALGGGKAHTRANAAHWLADRRRRDAVPEILAAFRKEKPGASKDSLLVALERLGTPIGDLLDRENLLAECQAVAAKGVPPALAWFPIAKLPEVHWEDGGARVDPAILTGLLIRACKLATPRPSPDLRRYCALWRGAERAAVGRFILNAWIARDVGDKVPGGQVVTMPAPAHAPTAVPQTPNQPGLLLKLVAMAMTGPVAASPPHPSTSAIREKGILAIAAACCGDGAVPVVSEYLKKWYGYRAAQCRALLGILPWMDSAPATQLLLSTARRFRTAGIREEAEALCLELAAWKGWSMDQLGDRTIPAAGFDDGPDQELNLGGRRLVLTLTPQLTVEVRSADGKPLKDFPAQIRSDDEALYRQAKETFAGTKKAIRNIVRQQTERLYEAMCCERVWRMAELRDLLFGHPVAGRLCQRLIWETADAPAVTFRPLDDGTLSGARDGQVELSPDRQVRIAYGPADAGEWLRHLADYEVAPLFPQLDRALCGPSGPDADVLRDFEGHSVGFFALRNLAARFGYQRGELVDGPFFSTYTKRLAGLSLNVELEFSGMDMPGEDKPVVLTEMQFLRDGQHVPLSQVPRVLLSECWHDLRAIAAAGTGYDPNWKDKVPF